MPDEGAGGSEASGSGTQTAGKSKRTRKRSGDRGGLTKSMVQEGGYLLQLRLCRAGVEVEACGFSSKARQRCNSPCSQCGEGGGGSRFGPQGTRSRMPQLKIPPATTKNWRSRIHTFFFFFFSKKQDSASLDWGSEEPSGH